MRLQPTSLRTQLINSLLALSAGNFVIGKRHQQLLWRYLIHHKPIQVLVKQRLLLSLQVQYQNVPIFLPEEQQLKLMREPMQFINYSDSAITTTFLLFQQGFVIGKATPTATLSNSPQTYTGSGQATTVTISSSSVPGAVSNILTGGQQLKLMEPMRLQPTFLDSADYNSLQLFQQGIL
jgi:hypothetical protein